MVLLHHEVEVEFPDGRPTENHWATLLEFGRVQNDKTTSAMALTVGIPAAIGALVILHLMLPNMASLIKLANYYSFSLLLLLQLLLQNNVQSRGVIRPLEPEVYMPG